MNSFFAKLCTHFIKSKEKRTFIEELLSDKKKYNETRAMLSMVEKDIPFYNKKPEDYKVIMLLLVKDEEDIIENNLIFHKNMGVDGFIVTDNNSTDGTLDILQKYKDKGWILEIIREPGKLFLQAEWVNQMAVLARDNYGADWIISADADEFFYANSHNIKQDLYENRFANALKVNIKNSFPLETDADYIEGKYFMSRRLTPTELDKISASVGGIYQTNPKTIVAAQAFWSYRYGNHDATVYNRKTANISNIEIFHYAVRNLKHFEKKIKNGGEALLEHPDKQIGTHWRIWYEKYYLTGKIADLYNLLYSPNKLQFMLDSGYISVDTRVRDFMQEIKAAENDKTCDL